MPRPHAPHRPPAGRRPPTAPAVLAARMAVALAVTGPGCGGKAHPAGAGDCRKLAVHGQRLIEDTAAAEREAATRLVVGLIDLCQQPGLAESTRTCVLAAASTAEIRACPALTEVVGDATADDGAPSCRKAVDHAMDLLDAGGNKPRSRTARDEARGAYLDGCTDLTPAGRRCVAAATTIAMVDDCFAAPELSQSAGSR